VFFGFMFVCSIVLDQGKRHGFSGELLRGFGEYVQVLDAGQPMAITAASRASTF
jgi:hypothetical protein